MSKKEQMCEFYMRLITNFFVLNDIKEVVCTDTKEHFFDRIEISKNGKLKVFKYGFTETTWNNLYFDFTCDYAKCLSNMEHDLYLQTRNGKHNMFTFYFTDEYEEPILFSMEEIDELEKEYEQRRNEVA